ncbi:hypothetical protein ACER0C_019893 [Sarotherodon galilaeus]
MSGYEDCKQKLKLELPTTACWTPKRGRSPALVNTAHWDDCWQRGWSPPAPATDRADLEVSSGESCYDQGSTAAQPRTRC